MFKKIESSNPERKITSLRHRSVYDNITIHIEAGMFRDAD
jgi:hypothetical protein